jgi:hypothetical protein
MSVPTCFENIIGYSRREDSCVDEAWDENFATSDSGLYVDELPGFPQRFVASLGGNYDIWDKMNNSMENAINAFKMDVVREILKYNEPVRTRFKGEIGCKTFSNTLTAYSYQGLRMYSDIHNGVFNLRGFYLILDTTEAVTLDIYDEYDLLYSYTLNATASRPVYNAITPIPLTLDRNYYFLFQTTGSPYDNRLDCNCGGWRWCFSCEYPCFGPSRLRWTEWAMVGGVCGDVLADRDEWGVSAQAKGLVLVGDFNCDIIGSLCDDYSDFSGNNEISMAMANAIWYKTGEFLSVYVLDSEEVSRRTLLGTEQWEANKEFYAAKYQEMVQFIAEHWESDEECLRCRDPYGFSLTSQVL